LQSKVDELSQTLRSEREAWAEQAAALAIEVQTATTASEAAAERATAAEQKAAALQQQLSVRAGEASVLRAQLEEASSAIVDASLRAESLESARLLAEEQRSAAVRSRDALAVEVDALKLGLGMAAPSPASQSLAVATPSPQRSGVASATDDVHDTARDQGAVDESRLGDVAVWRAKVSRARLARMTGSDRGGSRGCLWSRFHPGCPLCRLKRLPPSYWIRRNGAPKQTQLRLSCPSTETRLKLRTCVSALSAPLLMPSWRTSGSLWTTLSENELQCAKQTQA
jgi:hypothetical protein